MNILLQFPIIVSISTAAAIVVCLLTPPENDKILFSFYRTVRPWGFWGPVHRAMQAEHPGLEKNTNFSRDMINCCVGIIWQASLVTTPIYLVLRNGWFLTGSVAVLAATSVFLKFNWYDKLGPGDMSLDEACADG